MLVPTSTNLPSVSKASGKPRREALLSDELKDLVRRTEGPQVGRRFFHALWGVVLALLLTRAPVAHGALIGALAATLLLLAGFDLVRLKVPTVNAWFFRTFRWFASPREEAGLASSTWYIAGTLMVLAIFGRDIAIPSLLVLAFADPAASYIGRRWGKRKLGTGSVLGTTVFALVATVTLAFFVPPAHALLAGVTVALIECQPVGLDDNLTVPLGTALALTVAAAVVG